MEKSPKLEEGNYFPTHLFENEHAQVVDHIPKYIDGFKKYLIETNNYVKDTCDLRYFVMSTSSKAKYKGVRKVGTCHGSWECQNPYFGFMDTSVDKQPNRIDWITVKGKKDLKICSVCKHIVKRQGCGAHKLIDYNPKTKIAVVFHIGKHKCWRRFDDSHIIAAHHEKKKNKPRSGPAKDMAIDDILAVLDDPECTISGVELEADNRTDLRKVKRLQSTGRQDGNSFDVIGIVKRKIDTKDEFYIYHINNSNCNDGRDYVFKSSRKMIELAIKMDIDGDENIMQTDNAYFDATHSRVHGFKSFGLWVYHPSMWHILRLASMEIRSENSKDIAQFFKLFNELVTKVSKTEAKMFNPRTFMHDEGGANHKAIRIVYGDDFAKNKSCWMPMAFPK